MQRSIRVRQDSPGAAEIYLHKIIGPFSPTAASITFLPTLVSRNILSAVKLFSIAPERSAYLHPITSVSWRNLTNKRTGIVTVVRWQLLPRDGVGNDNFL